MTSRVLRPRPQPQPQPRSRPRPEPEPEPERNSAKRFCNSDDDRSSIDWVAEAKKVFNGTTIVFEFDGSHVKNSKKACEEIMSTINEELCVGEPKKAVEMLIARHACSQYLAPKIAKYIYIKIREVFQFLRILLNVEVWNAEVAALVAAAIKKEIGEHLGFEVSELKSLADLAEEVSNDTSKWELIKCETLKNRFQVLWRNIRHLESTLEQWSKKPTKTIGIFRNDPEWKHQDKPWYCKVLEFSDQTSNQIE